MREALTRLREAEEANEQQCSRTSNNRRAVATVTSSTKAAAGKREPASVRSLPKKYAKLPRASGSTDR